MNVFSQSLLARKIAIVSAIKLLGLLAIWWAFFSGHGERGMTADQAATAILHPVTGNSTKP